MKLRSGLTYTYKYDFPTWKRMVNYEVIKLCGVGCDDLPDFDYYIEWYDNVSHDEMARNIYREMYEQMIFLLI